MEVKIAFLGEADLLSKRRAISGPNVSLRDLRDSRQILKWICSFVCHGCLGIIGLENTNRNHLSAKINCLDVQTLPYSTIYWDLVGILDVSPFHRSFKLSRFFAN